MIYALLAMMNMKVIADMYPDEFELERKIKILVKTCF